MSKPYELTKKDWANIRSGLRSAFSRSDLREGVLEKSLRKHSDPSRPRVKKWSECYVCHKLDAKSNMDIDHIDPYVPSSMPFSAMTPYDMVYRLFCAESNLGAICPKCHLEKTNYEKSLKKELRRLAKLAAK